MAGDAKRDDKGRVQPGNSLRKTATRTRAKVISRRLKREMIRRYANKVLPGTDERMGKERAVIAHYFFLMDIMEDGLRKDTDRLRAIEMLGERLDGKPVTAIEISGPDGGPMETETTAGDELENLTPQQRLAHVLKSLGILAAHGGLNASGAVGGMGGLPATGDTGASGGSGEGD